MNLNTQQSRVTVTGVDLGSSSSKIAAIEKGTVSIITNEANLRQTPTLVAYGDQERLLGQSAYAKIKSNYSNTISAPHRYLGFSQGQFIAQESKLSPCRPNQENGILVFGVRQQQKKEKLLAEQVTAAFLTKIDGIVELNKLSNKFMVLAVPDYLTHHERKALLDSLLIARENASSKFGVQLINQSAAIGLDYGFYKKNQFPEKEENAQVTLFLDFGHRKLSAYAIKFTKKYQKVIFEQHQRQLGCKTFDELMYQFYSSLFQSQNKDLQIGVSESKRATLKLLQNIEKQRKVLSGNSELDFNIDCLLQEKDLSYTMKRKEFQQISQPVLELISKLFRNIKEKLKQMGISPANIQLVGGGSRIPCFIRTVSSVFGIEPSRTLNSSQCIARGAALYSAMASNLFLAQPYYSIELSPYNLRLHWKGEGQTMQIQSNVKTLLQKSQAINSEKQISFNLKVTNKKMLFQITDDQLPKELQNKICNFWIEFADWNGQHMEKKLVLTLKFDDNKMLNSVSASEMKQKESLLLVNELKFVEKLSQEKINYFIAKEKQDKARDTKIIANYQRKNLFQSHIYALKQNAINIAQNRSLRDFIKEERLEQILKYFSQLQANFQGIQNYDQEINKARKIVKQFQVGIQQARSKYLKIEEELNKFSEHIGAIIHGKVKNLRSYPAEQLEKMKQWVTKTLTQLRKQPKCQGLVTNLQEITSMRNVLKEKIQDYQAEELRKQQEQHKKYYQPKFSGNRTFHREPFESPLGPHHYDSYEPKTRGRNRNTSFGGFNPFSRFY